MQKVAKILLVDDDLSDVELIKECLDNVGIDLKIIHKKDGLECLQYLEELCDEGEGFPSLIFLDLNMPKKDGKEVLKEIKTNQRFKKIPVNIFTTSSSQKDIDFCYQHGANSYIVKPLGFEELQEVLKQSIQFWFSVVIMSDQ